MSLLWEMFTYPFILRAFVVGILVALPVSAVLLVALRRLMEAYSSSDLYAGDGLRKVAPSVPERLGADRAAPAAPAAFTAAEGPPAP